MSRLEVRWQLLCIRRSHTTALVSCTNAVCVVRALALLYRVRQWRCRTASTATRPPRCQSAAARRRAWRASSAFWPWRTASATPASRRQVYLQIAHHLSAGHHSCRVQTKQIGDILPQLEPTNGSLKHHAWSIGVAAHRPQSPRCPLPGFVPGVTPLGVFRPPAPQDGQMQAAQLHQFAGAMPPVQLPRFANPCYISSRVSMQCAEAAYVQPIPTARCSACS